MYGGNNYNHSHQPHHHYPSHYHKGGPTAGLPPVSPESAHATEIFDHFIVATTFKSVLHHYKLLCDVLRLRPTNIRNFYPKLKSKIRSWKAQAIWTKFDKRIAHKCYNHGKACNDTKVLIIGCGPCGLRSAIEAQLLGAKVVVVEKRDRFSRNNVLHLWPFVIADLKALGAKKFYGKFCAGAIDHISIRQLQCILLKVALLLGVEIFEGVTFDELLEPPEDQSQRIGWHARFSPAENPVNQYEFDVLIGADGKRNTLMGFKRKEFRGKLAIAITANFINKHSEQEARVQEISGVAFIFNQKFFKDLYADTGIDLENIVYYKDETHYFVMTAKKHSLIDKGVILRDLPDTQQLLHPNNVDRQALCDYAREAADFSTGYLMPHLEFAVNHYGKPDIAMFDFTSMFAAENACRVIEKNGHKLLKCLVGDSLLEPFWPTGSGCARGFLSSFDACWATRSWAANKAKPLEVIAERESIYRLLAQTTPENLSKDYSSYTLEPSSRYPTVNLKVLLPFQVRHLFNTDEPDTVDMQVDGQLDLVKSASVELPRKRKRRDSIIHPETLLSWCQKQVSQHPEIEIENLSSSFKDGRVLCAIIHRYRPDLIDFESLNPEEEALNNQLALDILEKEFGIVPILSGAELSSDMASKPCLMSFISQIHDSFRGEIPQSMGSKPPLKSLKGQNIVHLDLEDFPTHTKNLLDTESSYTGSSVSSPSSASRISCKILEEPQISVASQESLQLIKKRRNEVGSMDKLDSESYDNYQRSGFSDPSDQFSDRVRGLEAKFKGESSHQKPKDMIRAIGRLERTDWNLSAIERKIEDNPKPQMNKSEKERVPKWSKDVYNDKFQNIERRLRENGEDEERIAKYLDIDASLQRLERKLREGSTLETGLRGHNKVSNLANQLSSKLVRQVEDKTVPVPKQVRAMVLPSTTSDLCYFCDTRVYLVERLSAEGKFFHRQCFKCNYCGALLRLGNYIYDREHRFGGKFFCIPHFGLTVRSRVPKRPEEAARAKDAAPIPRPDSYFGRNIGELPCRGEITPIVAKDGATKGRPISIMTPQLKKVVSPLATLADRGTTPERVEFENSVIEHSDEEEYLSEEEWTDRNFGASANELDEDDDDSDYSDLSDEEIDEEAIESPHQLTADETRRLAESWKRRYSNDVLEGSDHESPSDSEIDELSEEHGADGDESHTATEGDVGEGEEEEELENDKEKRARELRRLEFNINIEAPPKAETSDSGSETEIASEEDSDTEIDTDSEFAEDHITSHKHKEIPTIVIDEMPLEANNSGGSADHIQVEDASTEKEFKNKINEKIQESPKKAYIAQAVQYNGGSERSSSSVKLPPSDEPNPRTEQLKRLLKRTESTEAVSAYKSSLRRQYLLGNNSSVPKKSVSSADLGDRFKSFMDKISETQKKLNPAPEPSPAMQAFLNSSSVSSLSSSPTRSSTITLGKLTSPITPLPSSIVQSSSKPIVNGNCVLSASQTEESSDTSKSEEGKIFSFPDIPKPSGENSANIDIKLSNNTSDNENVPFKSKLPSLDESEKDINKNNKEITLIEELSFPVHLEEETDNIFCVDAKNICMIESLAPNTSKDNLGSIHDFLSAKDNLRDSKLILNDELSALPAQQDVAELLTLQLIENKNNKNVSNDSIILEDVDLIANCSEADIDIDECFDQLAKDAMSEIPLMESSIAPLMEDDLSFKEKEPINFTNLESLKGNSIDSNFNLKLAKMGETFEKEKKDANVLISLDTKSTLKENIEELNIVPYSPKEPDSQEIQSPETVGLTECDLSDWAEDNEVISFGGDELREELVPYKVSTKKNDLLPIASLNVNRIRARIASLESLEDSDSAVSIGAGKNEAVPSPKQSVLNDIEQGLDYMDTSGSESSLDDNTNIVPFSYKKLQDETPVTTPTIDAVEKVILASYDCSTSKDISCIGLDDNIVPFSYKKLVDETPVTSPTIEAAEKINLANYDCATSIDILCKDDKPLSNFKSKSLESEEVIGDSILRSASEPQVLIEKPVAKESLSKPITPKRYEGYIPRFKDRVTPFSLVRDSIDVRKCSSSTPLFTPSKEDILQREANERLCQNMSLSFESSGSSLNSPSLNVPVPPITCITPVSPVTNSSFSLTSGDSSLVTSSVNSSLSKDSINISSTGRNSILSSKSMGRKPKDGDVVKDMVMSRVTKRSPDKVNRRGSRNALHLSFNSSTSSLFGSEPSLNKGSNTPASADISKSVKDSEFSFTSDSSYKKGIDESLNICTVPSMSNRSMIDLSDRTSAKPINSDKEIEIASPRKVLPATPLTHPEKFQNESLLKRDLFKSSPHLSSSTPSDQSSCLSPIIPQIPDSTPSDQSSCLSPVTPQIPDAPSYSSNDSFNVKNSSSTAPYKYAHNKTAVRAQSESPLPKLKSANGNSHLEGSMRGKILSNPRDRQSSSVPIEKTKKNPEERLKELLAERKKKESEEQREVRLRNKDTCLQECLEEYRQKRNSAPIPQGFSITKEAIITDIPKLQNNSNLGNNKRHFHRPSILELESMQVFSSPNKAATSVIDSSEKALGIASPLASLSLQESVTNISIVPTTVTSTLSFRPQSPTLSTPPLTPSSIVTPTSAKSVEVPKKSVKKSKDRERRRSLIQVFAGMFTKSEDKKKTEDEVDSNLNASSNHPSHIGLPVSPPPVLPPKSPSVKERFTKLRLSRSKDKKKPKTTNKNRSASADIPGEGVDEGLPSSLSLPTSPSRTIFSFLSSPSTRSERTKHSASEENGSEEEGSLHATGAPYGGKDTLPCNATPSTRRQKAVLRAAKQAEQNRLRKAQEIQRKLEECEVMTRELEEKGIKIEKALADETDGSCREETVLTKEWFRLVREKNELIRWQEELMIKAKELELEDRHVRLENELRQRMTCSERDKTRDDIDREGRILAEIISVIEEKDALVNQMEEERLRYAEEDKELEALEARKILQQASFQQETGV